MERELEKLKKDLKDQSFFLGTRRRKDAARQLGMIGTREAIPLLIQASGDSSVRVAEIARESLSQIKDEKAVETFCDYLIENRDDKLAALYIKCNYQARNIDKTLLFNFLHKQYHKIKVGDEAEIQALAEMIENAPEQIKQRCHESFRDCGDTRFARIMEYGTQGRQKDRKEWTGADRRARIEMFKKTKSYNELFEMLEVTNFGEALEIIEILDQVKFVPKDQGKKLLFGELKHMMPKIKSLKCIKFEQSETPMDDFIDMLEGPVFRVKKDQELLNILKNGHLFDKPPALWELQKRGNNNLTNEIKEAINHEEPVYFLTGILCKKFEVEEVDWEFLFKIVTHPVQFVRICSLDKVLETIPARDDARLLAPFNTLINRLQNVRQEETGKYAYEVSQMMLFLLKKNITGFILTEEREQGFKKDDIGISRN